MKTEDLYQKTFGPWRANYGFYNRKARAGRVNINPSDECYVTIDRTRTRLTFSEQIEEETDIQERLAAIEAVRERMDSPSYLHQAVVQDDYKRDLDALNSEEEDLRSLLADGKRKRKITRYRVLRSIPLEKITLIQEKSGLIREQITIDFESDTLDLPGSPKLDKIIIQPIATYKSLAQAIRREMYTAIKNAVAVVGVTPILKPLDGGGGKRRRKTKRRKSMRKKKSTKKRRTKKRKTKKRRSRR